MLVTIKVFCLPNPFNRVRAVCERPKNIIDGIRSTINLPAVSCLKNVFARYGAKSKTRTENITVIESVIKNESEKCRYPKSATKILQMLKGYRDGFVSFWQ